MKAVPEVWTEEADRLRRCAEGCLPSASGPKSAAMPPADPVQHTCWYSYHYQKAHSPSAAYRAYHDDDFQLPEPFAGAPAAAEVAVIGQNPGYRFDETIPRRGNGLDDYIAFYAKRFDTRLQGKPCALHSGALKPMNHYAEVESVLPARLRLGTGAVYLDAIPWKWGGRWDAASAKVQPPKWSDLQPEARARVLRMAAAMPQLRAVLIVGACTAQLCGCGPLPSKQTPVVWAKLGAVHGRPTLLVFHPGAFGGIWHNRVVPEASDKLRHVVGSPSP